VRQRANPRTRTRTRVRLSTGDAQTTSERARGTREGLDERDRTVFGRPHERVHALGEGQIDAEQPPARPTACSCAIGGVKLLERHHGTAKAVTGSSRARGKRVVHRTCPDDMESEAPSSESRAPGNEQAW